MTFSCFVFTRGLAKETGMKNIGTNFGDRETSSVYWSFFFVESAQQDELHLSSFLSFFYFIFVGWVVGYTTQVASHLVKSIKHNVDNR